jgi:hypothetical protein
MLDWAEKQGLDFRHDPIPEEGIDQYSCAVDRKTLMLIKLTFGGSV